MTAAEFQKRKGLSFVSLVVRHGTYVAYAAIPTRGVGIAADMDLEKALLRALCLASN